MRMTKRENTSNHYVLVGNDDQMTNQNLIDLLGEKEDFIEKIWDKTSELIDSMMKLLAITKGEKDDIVKHITALIEDINET